MIDEDTVREIHRVAGKFLRELADQEIHAEFPRVRFLRTLYGKMKVKDTYCLIALLIGEDREEVEKFYKKTDELRKEIGEKETDVESIVRECKLE